MTPRNKPTGMSVNNDRTENTEPRTEIIMAGFIKYTDRAGMTMLICYDLLNCITHVHLVPLVQRQKLLKVSRRQSSGISHGFDALSLQVRELAGDVCLESFGRLYTSKAVIESSSRSE